MQLLFIPSALPFKVVCVVRVLMHSRCEKAYITMFDFIKSLASAMKPTRIHCDFERAAINALRRVFPDADIVGCLWHFGAVSLNILSVCFALTVP